MLTANAFTPDTFIDFWFNKIDRKQWWTKDPAFVATIREQFGTLLNQAKACEL